MTRRHLFPALLGWAASARPARQAVSLGGCALLLDLRNGRLLVSEGAEVARRLVAAPGSTLKPLSLLALLEANKLALQEEYFCSRHLVLNGQRLDCSHPNIAAPMNVSRAIAYSCNCAVAHFARRFEIGELARYLLRSGICSRTGLLPDSEATGHIEPASAGPATQLQALGQSPAAVTPLGLLAAYRNLALRVGRPLFAPILDGLESAVEFGTARAAQLPRVSVAGKTGSVMSATGLHAAWFAGFAPSRFPEVAVLVLVQGRSGGADAAPIAASLLRTYFASRP
ncbi:MAG: hypothetical protein JO340_17925 [Acidobacteriaceae bacterium]|nr:hypothetical protein [Acidobacteriaceae bacterium]